jgi:hypothetical protein
VGVWSKPDVPLLIFSDNFPIGTTLSFHGGALGGAAAGHPLQLVFWGDFWLSFAGKQRCALIEERTKALLESPYFNELAQYGIPHAPTWRGSKIVTKPVPPQSTPDSKTISQQVVGLIQTLIDDDVFPDPDEGPRMLFIVLMPDGFKVPKDAIGAHQMGYDNDFPFNLLDKDNFWAGWVGPQPDTPEFTMAVLGHEVVETLTDPESDGWHTEMGPPVDEIADAGFSDNIPAQPGKPAQPGTAQTAFVNGVQVQSYWSNRHSATVIPIDRDYAAQLRAQVNVITRFQHDSGPFRPDPSDSIACPKLPECCMQDREYAFRIDAIEEVAQIQLQTIRYKEPIVDWRINGVAISGESDITLNLDVEGFSGRTATVTNQPVMLHYVTSNNGLKVSPVGVVGNFEVNIACSVQDGSITGNVATNVIATPQIAIGFVGAELLLEDAYTKQRSACITAMVKRYIVQSKPTGKIGPNEGINFDPGIFVRDLPAYVRPSQYGSVRWMAKAARAAHVLLESEQAQLLTSVLLTEIPVLSRNVAPPPPNVDIAAILDDLAKKNPEELDWRRSIVDLMKLVAMDSSLAARKQLATELHYTGNMEDSASMNVWLHKQVLIKLAETGGKIPPTFSAGHVLG